MSKNERNYWLDWVLFFVFLTTICSGFLLWIAIPNDSLATFARINRTVLDNLSYRIWLNRFVGRDNPYQLALALAQSLAWKAGSNAESTSSDKPNNQPFDLVCLYHIECFRFTGLAAIWQCDNREN